MITDRGFFKEKKELYMGQSTSAPYPFGTEVETVISELQASDPFGWQSLIDEVCRHRSLYLEYGHSVVPVDQMLYQIAHACKDLLHEGLVKIPCLSIRWVDLWSGGKSQVVPASITTPKNLSDHQDIFYATPKYLPVVTCMKSVIRFKNWLTHTQMVQSGRSRCNSWHNF